MVIRHNMRNKMPMTMEIKDP